MAVRVPKEAAAKVGLREGAVVDLTIENDAIVLRRRRHDIRELISRIAIDDAPPMLEDQPRGKEVW